MPDSTRKMTKTAMTRKALSGLLGLLMQLLPLTAVAQINIGGSIYGGGNQGDVGGNATVTVRAGDLDRVFGGARMANVGGRAFVNIDGENASDFILINYVYGGNDISGTIGSSTVPDEITEETDNPVPVDETWNAFVRVSRSTKEETTGVGEGATTEIVDDKKIYFGQLFGGGNGDYYYSTTPDGDGNYVVKTSESALETIVTSTTPFTRPDLGKTYLELLGGSIVTVYGGGNNATVTEETVIHFDNPSEVVSKILDENDVDLITKDNRPKDKMGLNPGYTYPSSDQYQIGNFFGGNNKAEMAIRPKWQLKQGKIRNLYSGGNRGRMTSPEGLLLVIQPESDDLLHIGDVYGGCRMADVCPTVNGVYTPTTNIEPYHFPDEFAARLLIYGGTINNVYGGNDITGKVYGGNALGVYSDIQGNIYGGGNGSYPYTDNVAMKDDQTYGDFYYDPGSSSVDALNAFRPNAEQVSLRLKGTVEEPTIIRGSVFLGGNSATLQPKDAEATPLVELKVGSYVVVNNTFLGNNGENMVKTNEEDAEHYIHEGVLRTMKSTDLTGNGTKFNSLDLTDSETFAKYMDGAAMRIMPRVVFDDMTLGDPDTYIEYSSYFGSIFGGGNRGSMTKPGCETIDFSHKIIIFGKLVGGCNDAIVDSVPEFNARYEGGIIGAADPGTGNRLQLNLSGLKIEPKRWREPYDEDATTYPDKYLEWNTVIDGENVSAITSGSATPEAPVTSSDEDLKRRFEGGNIYGGCYSSGIVEGNVVINLNASIVEREKLFDVVQEDTLGEAIYYANDNYQITERHTGVILGQQGMDVLGKALNVFGGGYGKQTAIWGNTTINLNRGYTFQVFGGSQEGIIGKSREDSGEDGDEGDYEFNGEHYAQNSAYSCYVNLRGLKAGVSKRKDHSEDMAECEFLYGGGFLGPICGNTVINLGKGRIFNSFAGSCNADILGHTETYIGRQVKDSYKNTLGAHVDEEGTYEEGFPWVRDIVYGANDLGGKVKGSKDFVGRVRSEVIEKVHDYSNSTSTSDVLTASAYVEYLQGRATGIFGGCYGTYDYTDHQYKDFFYTAAKDEDENVVYDEGANSGNLGQARPGYSKPFLDNAFVNFRPSYTNENNMVQKVYGAGQGIKDEPERDLMQNRSYVLIDIPQVEDTYMKYYANMEVFGAGAYGGLGMIYNKATTEAADFNLNKASAVIDLMRGKVKDVFGGSFEEGVTRRTVINVPKGSTIQLKRIFGGAYGDNPLIPCDVYEAHVNYHSADACVEKIFGGNNSADRTLYGQINIDVPVYTGAVGSDGTRYQATVFGGGYGKDTWSQYTEVNLLSGASVYEVYGGGNNGMVLNLESLIKWRQDEGEALDLSLPGYENEDITYTDKDTKEFHLDHGLNSPLVKPARLDGKKYNANVHIYEGATVGNYAYGGGLGADADVSGTTCIELLGGTVVKDIYAAGTSGAVLDYYNAKTFTASATAYIESGTCRNVYGGGWEGIVGKHVKTVEGNEVDAAISEVAGTTDVSGATYVVIGKTDGDSFINGIPAIKRNAYAGGEGGAVFGTANLTLLNGYIGYEYNPALSDDPETELDDRYEEKIIDETWKDKEGNFIPNTNLLNSGNIFGGGYIDNSYVDSTCVTLYGGNVRNSVFGGGEIAAIGRGAVDEGGEHNVERTNVVIYGAGKTHIYMYGGHVMRNVFGGGKGIDNLGRTGSLYTDGYVFGQTDVNIYGGEIGTEAGIAQGYGNVFGGGDIGFVYSAYQNASGALCFGKSSGARYDDGDEGYYYEYENGAFKLDNEEKILTEDIHVLVEPRTKVLASYEEPRLDGSGNPVLDGSGNPIIDIIPVANVTINGHTYTPGQYVPIDDLNTLKNKNTDAAIWKKLDVSGIIIHNAVFAGGNVSSGSDQVYANTYTVFGNATASIHDVYHRDLITLGTGHTGGLYGDGNLTFVDGYRGLNITNYGTDYYSISKEVTIDQYHALPAREQAYYELKYKCKLACTDKDGTRYTPGDGGSSKASTITADDLLVLFMNEDGTASVRVDEKGDRVKTGDSGTPVLLKEGEKWVPNPTYWEENGVLPVYAGRLMNSIQRADFCGVFGSRMVMQGARDRVPEIVDLTNYTINRVREVSLNKKISTAGDDPSSEGYQHGNYFGIYNIVNYLGALTSDFDFGDGGAGDGHGDIRTTDNNDAGKYKADISVSSGNYQYGESGYTFYNWKEAFVHDRRRNNGNSHNKLALASGVYLELITEKSRGTDLYEKDWGLITGVVELDLINVKTGIGGGFVYARNEHGVRSRTNKKHITLTALNKGAVTSDDFSYDRTESTKKEWQTSGNFVHSSQIIIDDCYNISGKYKSNYNKPDGVPAHYWYIKGSVYVYDQYISAYTGAPNAYSETVEIPLTITAASHGAMKLLNVQPNRYAYYSSLNNVLEPEKKVIINDVTYYKNTPISYWDWSLLSNAERNLFVSETYVTIADCKIGETEYPEGTVLLPDEYNTLRNNNDSVFHIVQNKKVAFDYAFRLSNNLSHDTGYLLTYTVNNPTSWDKYYTPLTEPSLSGKITNDVYEAMSVDDKERYTSGPTYTPITSGLYGQRDYKLADIISKEVYVTYAGFDENEDGTYEIKGVKQTHPSVIPASGQAVFEPAYVVTQYVETNNKNGTEQHLQKGAKLAKSEYTDAQWAALSGSGSVAPAYVCTSTIQLTNTEYIYGDANMLLTESEINLYKDDYPALVADIEKYIVPAYYCTSEGLYGGDYYESGKNYRALETWSSMSDTDRENFTFNYDALDLLIDPLYSKNAAGTEIYTEGHKYQYDSAAGDDTGAVANPAHYSLSQPVDYTAEYNSDTPLSLGATTITVNRYNEETEKNESTSTNEIKKGDELTRTVFEESLANEQRHYAPITPKAEDDNKVYVVNTPFQIGNTPYTIGQTISSSEYTSLGDGSDRGCVTVLQFDSEDADKTFYFCRESYEIATGGHKVKNILDANNETNTYSVGNTVPLGVVIKANNEDDCTGFANLTNQQKDFTIHGIAPTEVSTLYVSRESDIFDLSTEKIITVIYQYDYEESDASGNITPITERHVVNIHLKFMSGVPDIEDIRSPNIVLPGTSVTLRTPTVTPGAYEVMGGGWELYEKEDDAESHTNGIEYTPSTDPLYWYQDGYYVAYYAKTYLGKTFSNHVPVTVANYHDLKEVMDDAVNHLHVDYDPQRLHRECKIYINDYTGESKDGLDQLKDFYDLSLLTTSVVNTDANGLITTDKSTSADSPFKGHALLNHYVKGGDNLEFFLRTDIDHSTSWTPIGETQCFGGTFHGDGHTISGLNNSLFDKLCGDVYNLGVTGTFVTAGVANEGDGYVENCWISTSNEAAKTMQPVFGTPTITGEPPTRPYRIVNCYYEEEADGVAHPYTNHTGSYGIPTRKSKQAFYNGEVAYNLNGFYLYKRYCDQTFSEQPEHGSTYSFYNVNADNTLSAVQTKYYDRDANLCSAGYVESRFADGDFRYADHSIPTDADERAFTDASTGTTSYYPIWPDDYIFFGQKLTYGHVEGSEHQDYPSVINYNENRIVIDETGNRVYRAPAYFRSKQMKVAYFNPDAIFARTNEEGTITVHKDMTAIDFTGGNSDISSGYNKGSVSAAPYAAIADGAFYPPLLDDDGLTSFTSYGLTSNLLVYTGAHGGTGQGEKPNAMQKTANAVSVYLPDEAYSETHATYHTVAPWDSHSDNVHGHWVELTGADAYTAPHDHMLVDKQDFNAPIGYTFADGHRMWYQRMPDIYVGSLKDGSGTYIAGTGWDGISLPFKAEVVTTDVKGELTHFYGGSTAGHEYWLREFKGGQESASEAKVFEAALQYPAANAEDGNKHYTNTFLWDYYYSYNDYDDLNKDDYQEDDKNRTYYKNARDYADYPRFAAAVPYIIGFPGDRYYEFDLSGSFEAKTAKAIIPAMLEAQTVTFASAPSNTDGFPVVTIGVSDDEAAAGVTPEGCSYTFKPSYLNTPAVTTGKHAFLLNNDGDRYEETDEATAAIVAFRPYFEASAPVSPAPRRSIVFKNDGSSHDIHGQYETDDPDNPEDPGRLTFNPGRRAIIAASSLRHEAGVRIVNAAGLTVAEFTIQPGETIATPVNVAGVYIVNNKKIVVK